MGLIANKIPYFEDHERFISKIAIDQKTGCWNYTAGKFKLGYGAFSIKRKLYKAHRISWSIFKGDLDVHLVLDHTCRNRACVNPDHLREVDRKTNTLENSVGIAFKNSLKTHCPNGHLLEEGNLLNVKNERNCRTCYRVYDAAFRRKKRALKKLELK